MAHINKTNTSIILNKKQLQLQWLSVNKIIKLFKEEFINYFDLDLLKDIKKVSQEEIDLIYHLKYLYTHNILTKNEWNNKYIDGECISMWSKKFKIYRYPKEFVNIRKGASYRGKKRPEHSAIMKIKMKECANNRSDEHKKNLKTFLQTTYYKKRCITLNLVTIDESEKLSFEELKEKYNVYHKKYMVSDEHRIKKINKFKTKIYYKEFPGYETFCKKYENISTENLQDAFRDMLSIISTKAMELKPNMGNTKYFKRGIIEVNECINKSIIKYRSSYELKTIEFLETNKIKYEWEPFYIEKINGGLYLPDIVIRKNEINNKKDIIIEIKGFIRGEDGKKIEEIKKESAIKYSKENNYSYSYISDYLQNINQIKNNLLWD